MSPPFPLSFTKMHYRFLDSILVSGLQPQRRQSVHLSQDVTTATAFLSLVRYNSSNL
jgi:RNA:NAD 2'-phosphotransferase (TPT1/KptA family)